jgi:hypothetical protein
VEFSSGTGSFSSSDLGANPALSVRLGMGNFEGLELLSKMRFIQMPSRDDEDK